MNFYKLLGFDPSRHNRRTELMAGFTTFLTMSYILAVNPDILSQAGMDQGAVFTATALASAIGTILIACPSSEHGYQCILCLYARKRDGV